MDKSKASSHYSSLPYIHDSGERQQFDTGAVRDPSEGKGRYDLVSLYALERLALHYESGAKKYDDRNWEKGIPASRCFSSAMRHLIKWAMGLTEEDHLAAAAWNIFAIMHFETRNPEMIDIGSAVEGPEPGDPSMQEAVYEAFVAGALEAETLKVIKEKEDEEAIRRVMVEGARDAFERVHNKKPCKEDK